MSSLLQLPNGLNVNSIKNLIFDLGNVVVDIDPGASEALFTKLGATNFPNLPPNVHPQFVTGNINAQHFRAVARTSFGLPGIVTDAEFDHAWSAPILAIPRDRLELLEELRGNSGYKVYVLSNSDPILTERLNKIHLMHHNQYPLDSLFDKIFYSFEIGCRKPDEEAYKCVIDDLHLVPCETLFMDDSNINVQAARRCGLHAVRIDIKTDLSPLKR